MRAVTSPGSRRTLILLLAVVAPKVLVRLLMVSAGAVSVLIRCPICCRILTVPVA
jgi:hypothetical protein